MASTCSFGKTLLFDGLVKVVHEIRKLFLYFNFLLAGSIDIVLNLLVLLLQFDLRPVLRDVLLHLANADVQAAEQLFAHRRLQHGSGSHHFASALQHFQSLFRLFLFHLLRLALLPSDFASNLPSRYLRGG